MLNTVIISGADGFIGRHLTSFFSKQNFVVYALVVPDNPNADRIRTIPNVIVVEGNLLEWTALKEKLPKSSVAFIHLAWMGVSTEQREDLETQKINIDLALNAVRLASELNAKRFILPGSTAEYVESGGLINEKSYPSPQTAYGAVKVATRFLCKILCEEMNIPYIYTVITGIYAADRIDNNVIYYTVSQLLDGKRPSYTKLEQRWDYVHIDDVVLALYLIATKGKSGSFYGIGHGDNCQLSEYICKIRDLIDKNLTLGIGEIPYKNDKLPSSCVDMASLMNDTGFKPLVSFEKGIQEVIETLQKQRSE